MIFLSSTKWDRSTSLASWPTKYREGVRTFDWYIAYSYAYKLKIYLRSFCDFWPLGLWTSSRLLSFQAFGHSDFWTSGLFNFWDRTFGLLGFWTLGLLGFFAFGFLGFWISSLSGFWDLGLLALGLLDFLAFRLLYSWVFRLLYLKQILKYWCNNGYPAPTLSSLIPSNALHATKYRFISQKLAFGQPCGDVTEYCQTTDISGLAGRLYTQQRRAVAIRIMGRRSAMPSQRW